MPPITGSRYANNRALMTCDARYVLFLNPDTEILRGILQRPGPRDGCATERRAGRRSAGRWRGPPGHDDPPLPECASSARRCVLGRAPARPPALARRARARSSGLRSRGRLRLDKRSFMLARREAIESAGFLDERFFMYSEETDLCRRIKSAGWDVRHLPSMTIFHYGARSRWTRASRASAPTTASPTRASTSRRCTASSTQSPCSCATCFGPYAGAAAIWDGAAGRPAGRAEHAAGPPPVPYGPPSRFSVRSRGRPHGRATVADLTHAGQVDE